MVSLCLCLCLCLLLSHVTFTSGVAANLRSLLSGETLEQDLGVGVDA